MSPVIAHGTTVGELKRALAGLPDAARFNMETNGNDLDADRPEYAEVHIGINSSGEAFAQHEAPYPMHMFCEGYGPDGRECGKRVTCADGFFLPGHGGWTDFAAYCEDCVARRDPWVREAGIEGRKRIPSKYG